MMETQKKVGMPNKICRVSIKIPAHIPVFLKSFGCQVQPFQYDIIHPPSYGLNIGPGHGPVDGGDAAQTISLDHCGGIRRGITGILQLNLFVDRHPDRITGGTHQIQKQHHRQSNHHRQNLY